MTELLVLEPGPSPLTDETWPGPLVQVLAGPGGWGVVNLSSLGPVANELAERIEQLGSADTHRAGGELYEACRRAALSVVARRLTEEVVARDPGIADVLLLRLAGGAEHLELEIAPARLVDHGLVTGVSLVPQLITPQGVLAFDEAASDGTEVDVILPGAPAPARLPAVELVWQGVTLGAGDTGVVEVRLDDRRTAALQLTPS